MEVQCNIYSISILCMYVKGILNLFHIKQQWCLQCSAVWLHIMVEQIKQKISNSRIFITNLCHFFLLNKYIFFMVKGNSILHMNITSHDPIAPLTYGSSHTHVK